MELFVFQVYPICNFGKFVNFGLGTVWRERAKPSFPQNNDNGIFARVGDVSEITRVSAANE